jgi:hypothetical protein
MQRSQLRAASGVAIRRAGLNQSLVPFGPHDGVQMRIHRSDLFDVRADDLFGGNPP